MQEDIWWLATRNGSKSGEATKWLTPLIPLLSLLHNQVFAKIIFYADRYTLPRVIRFFAAQQNDSGIFNVSTMNLCGHFAKDSYYYDVVYYWIHYLDIDGNVSIDLAMC